MLLVSLCLAPGAGAQTLFTTEDFRADRALWTEPAYYLHNTVPELRGMALDLDSRGVGSGQVGAARLYASQGTGRVGAMDLASPYPFSSAAEHYAAWLADAGGGTAHGYATMPDWRGRWTGGGDRLRGGANPASAVAAMLTPQYREYFVQDMKAYTEGRIWGANSFCLPGGFVTALTAAEEFVVTPERVWILGAGNNRNYIRWIYTDGSGHAEPAFRYPKWHGESIGFWDDDALVVYTNQIRGWKGGLTEFTDDLETVERYRRVGDAIEGEITFYDAAVYVSPVYSRAYLPARSGDPPGAAAALQHLHRHQRTLHEGAHGRAGSAERAPGGRSPVLGCDRPAPVGHVPGHQRPALRGVSRVAGSRRQLSAAPGGRGRGACAAERAVES